jgi:anti-anti-sigma regulatory factor
MPGFNFKQYTGNTGVLTLHGDLTAQRAEELREAFLMSIDQSDHLIINMDKVSMIDDFCLQQIKVVRNISKRLNKRITVGRLGRNRQAEILSEDFPDQVG